MVSGSGCSRLRAAALVGVAAIVANLVSAGATTGAAPDAAPPEEGGVNELTVGDWSGIGSASGISWANQGGAQLLWVAGFENRFFFTVTENDVTGTFTLTSSGMYSAPQMALKFSTAGREFTAHWNIDPPARGTIDGDRSLLVFNAGNVTTTGTISIPGIGTQAISGQPSPATITNTITHLECDSATGNWEVSLIQQIENQGWQPNWAGVWVAFPVPVEGQQTEAEALVDGLDQLFSDFGDFSATAGNALDPEAQYDPGNINRAEMMELAARATEMANRLHNLSPCDAEAIGAETLQEWRTSLARGVGDLIIAAADALAALGDTVLLDYANLNALIVAADATGAHGSGSALGAGEAFQVEDALTYLTGESVEQHLNHADGNYGDCQDLCQHDHYLWAAGGVASAAAHGWSITVNGQTYSPAEAPQLLANPPGGST